MDNVASMNATATEFSGVALCIFNYLNEQTEPMDEATLKTRFFVLCQKTGFHPVVNLLVAVGALQRKRLVVGDKDDVILAVPHVMEQFTKTKLQ